MFKNRVAGDGVSRSALMSPPGVWTSTDSGSREPFPREITLPISMAQRLRGIHVLLLKGPLKETVSTKGELTNDSSCSFLPSWQPGGHVALINQSAHAATLTQMPPAVGLSHVSAGDKRHGVCWPVVPVGRAEMDACVPLCDRVVNHNEE